MEYINPWSTLCKGWSESFGMVVSYLINLLKYYLKVHYNHICNNQIQE